MASSFTSNKAHLEEPASGDYVNTWATPVNNNMTAVDNCLGGSVTINVVGITTTQIFTTSQYQPLNIVFSGTLSANLIYQFPTSVGGFWTVYNNTSGTYTITLASQTGGGTSLLIPQGSRIAVLCDGTNVMTFSNATNAAGSTTQVQYNASGFLAGSSNFTFSGTSLTVPNLYATGLVQAVTPNTTMSTTGGLQLVCDSTNNLAYLQILTNTGGQASWVQWNSSGTMNILNGVIVQGNLTVNSTTTISDTAGGTHTAGYLEVPPNTQAASYTAVLADSGKQIIMNASSGTFTIPANASVAYAVGTVLTIVNVNSSNLTIAINSDTLTKAGSTTTGSRTLTQNGIATCVKTGSTSWLITGTGIS
jgi:hypothetical protein